MTDDSDILTQEIPVAPREKPPGNGLSRFWAGLQTRVEAMSPRTRWLNLGLAILLIVMIVVAFLVIGNPSTPTVAVRTAAVTRGTVTASVTGSGNTASSASTPVSFQTTGIVTAVNVKAGDTVTLGEVLATIDPAAANATLATAKAQLAGAKAAYAQASAGPTAVKSQQDQLAVTTAQQNVDNANANLAAAQNTLGLDQTSTGTAIDNAQTKFNDDKASTDTAVQNAQNKKNSDQTIQDQTVASTTCPEVAPTTTGDPAPTSTPASGATTPPASASNGAVSGQDFGASYVVPTAVPYAGVQKVSFSYPMATRDCAAVRSAETNREAVLSADQGAVDAAQNSQNTTLDLDQQAVTNAQQAQAATLAKDNNAITTAQQQVTTSTGQVTSAQLALQADLHPMTPAQIAQSAAQVDSAQVSVNSAQRTVDQTVLKAPQAGVVLAVSGKVGESSSGGSGSSTGSSTSGTGAASAASAAATSAGSGFITIANLSRLSITANIAEADAAKIKLGQPATITFPATTTTATGSVTQITPQSTVTNNVVLYPITVALDSAPPGVGVGSTASLAITVGTADDVLVAPTAAITTLGTRHTVTVRRGTADTVVPVEIGVAGDTTTEITSGVAQGDVLVLPTATGAAATGGGAGGGGGGGGFPRVGGGG
ncbi:biotin/lipoyl-binding protein [Pseudonocardia sp. GCM10023141]|uniref:HlyD family efflux transporter periplasmic adaptor subunit n=1 Tax=Pseudonocardia sp. GCM10023141 TaxID=3252653 RepID=UPI00360DD752